MPIAMNLATHSDSFAISTSLFDDHQIYSVKDGRYHSINAIITTAIVWTAFEFSLMAVRSFSTVFSTVIFFFETMCQHNVQSSMMKSYRTSPLTKVNFKFFSD